MHQAIRAAAVCAAIAAGVAFSPAPAFPETTKWDQQRVTRIATQLAAAVKDLRINVEKNPDQPPGTARRAQYQAREDLRLLQYTTQQLASALAKGEDREATAPIFKRAELLRRDAEENGRKGMIPEPTLDKIAKAQDLLLQLGPYYAEE